MGIRKFSSLEQYVHAAQLTAPPYIIIESRYSTFEGDVRPIGPCSKPLEASCRHCSAERDIAVSTPSSRKMQ